MDYEKKYKEIVGQLKKAYLYAQTDSTKAVLEKIFPELKESEDEKVRKEIVRFIQMEVEDEIVGNKWLAWLEKQGETFTKRDIDDAYLKGISDAKNELEKQGEVPVTVNIDKMVRDYANDKELGNEEFGKPVPCMIRAYRQGLNDVIGIFAKNNPAWSEEDEEELFNAVYACLNFYGKDSDTTDWLKSLKQRIGG